ncbi:TetR/AcrR family transcriptional regulator [Thiolinea disciformis]|uniref:TetR/AcrR family transcriptional regulator n=1 Tax=Thiolinea disciformis TaxID=125614 RepID=UPI00036AAC0C|nr:TetR/AcrR family transcriptional regulator [Thiolinea disciformis]
MPPRAINPEDKSLKRESILDAAQHLWVAHPEHVSSMDALARASHVAKGTLYLYFGSKEEVLLALHERDVKHFFEQLVLRAKQPEPMTLEEMADIVIASIRHSPTFLPLASLCLGTMERQIPDQAVIEFKSRISEGLDQVVQALRAHFPAMSCVVMMQGYALILGLWQLLQQNSFNRLMAEKQIELACAFYMDEDEFLTLLSHSLVTLFQGLLAKTSQDQAL